MKNSPVVKLAIVGVSRDCFPMELTAKRLGQVVQSCKDIGLDICKCDTIIENYSDATKAVAEATAAGANAAVIYLGNFGPEGPLSTFAKNFPGPVMACAAAEESGDSLTEGRGDAYCGLLNASYNFSLRHTRVFIPQMPLGLPGKIAEMIAHFQAVARIMIGLGGLKIFTFGPRPHDFYACNAPIKPLYDLDIEVMENSELDMLLAFQKTDQADPAVTAIVDEMTEQLGDGNTYPDLLNKLARFELSLRRFAQENLGDRDYYVFANKCWPAFEEAFGFVPCYVNSRLAGAGVPVACEVDIYGALSEYMCQLASGSPATLLDVNNTVPPDMLGDADLLGAAAEDLFMGFHCGNTPGECMKDCAIKYQMIMHRLMEKPGSQPDITRGTLEGQIRPGEATVFRLQASADANLLSYLAQGNILDIDPRSFGGIGIFAVPDFARFYRHVLIAREFPHHTAVAFDHCGQALFDAVKLLGVDDISTPRPAGQLYAGENPFAV